MIRPVTRPARSATPSYAWCSAALLLAVTLLAARPAFAENGRYELDPDHLSIGFLVTHIGYAKTLGMFRKAEGSYRFDETSGELRDLKVVVLATWRGCFLFFKAHGYY